MNESIATTTRPPVLWWERSAAGVLAATWVGWWWVEAILPGRWWLVVSVGVRGVVKASEFVVSHSAGNLDAVFNSRLFLRGIQMGSWSGIYVITPVLIALGALIAAGCCRTPRRVWLWWLALGHGALLLLIWMVRSRGEAVDTVLANLPDSTPLSWHEGWLDYFAGAELTNLLHNCWPFLAEIPLAVAIIVAGRSRRRRAEEKEVPPPLRAV